MTARALPIAAALGAAMIVSVAASAAPTRPAPLWTGKDLSGWTAHVAKRAAGEDPRGVFRVVTVDGRPAIRVSGEELAGLTSQRTLGDYHLTLEFKWGEARHAPRATAPRDSGLLYHADGPAAPGTGWLESVEFGILEGGETGDFWSVPGAHGQRIHTDVEGDEIPPAARRYPGQPIRWRAGGKRWSATTSAIAIARDAEKPRGQWNRMDLYCLGQSAVHVVNGEVVLVLTGLSKKVDGTLRPLNAGKIQLQSEGAEVYFRDLRHRPISALPEAYRRLVTAPAPPNTLTLAERAAGWRLLFDGKSLAGFRGYGRKDVPPGWRVLDGAIVLAEKSGDLMTEQAFGSFDLSVEWKLGEGGNSGIYYLVDEQRKPMNLTAPEYELRDNRFWPEDPYKTAGNYGLHVPTSSPTRPVGEWNHSRVVVRDGAVEHWLNGEKVVAYRLGSADWKQAVAASKFRGTPSYGQARRGHVLFQDHGSKVAFRNVKVREQGEQVEPLAPAQAASWVKGDVTPPQARSGWRMELVATPPTIKHPSVVEVAPDGRVFVAEDPMDISAPSADLKLGRIVCLHPDGRVTVFAEGLHAVFGLLYLDGKLLVLHNPMLSVFDDQDGVGRNRRELIAQTHPNPWASGWNDHVPANFRLAMDGYLYLAVGDKGIHGAVGRDGRRLDMPGGGVVRLRPDGTRLEAFATGVRNILDVALDAEDEIFTYDNTDEQQWMSRLTHMVDGGKYGYPYDFIPRRPHTLWMMADYGGGAATGAVAYTEDALPLELRGNLFLSDFGKRQILRVPVARDGGTFKALFREDLLLLPPHDFRPVGVAWSADGMSLYVCDWNHTDNKEKVEVGRLYKLTWTGTSHAQPKPAWYLPAAMGRPFHATTAALVQGLSHPARSVRLVAQRRLAERGAAASGALRAALEDDRAPPHARWHALWALDAIDGGRGARAQIITLARSGELPLRRQTLRQLGGRRVAAALPALTAALRDPDASIRFQAATALGRVGDPRSVGPLVEALRETDLFARFSAFTALRRIGVARPAAWPVIVRALEDQRPAVREGVSFAMRDIYDERLVVALAAVARRSKLAEARRRALETLTLVHGKTPVWTGEYWGTHPAYAPLPRKTVAWAATTTVLAALDAGLGDPDAGARRAAVSGLAAAGVSKVGPRLRAAFEREPDLGVRQALLEALIALRDQGAGPLLARLLGDPQAPAALRARAVEAAPQVGGNEVEAALLGLLVRKDPERTLALGALRALGALHAAAAVPTLSAYTRHRDEELRRAALLAVARTAGSAAPAILLPMLRDPAPALRRDVVTALGAMADPKLVPRLLTAHADLPVRAEATAALARMPDLRALDVYLEGIASKSPELRAACAKAIGKIGRQALPILEKRASTLRPDVIASLQAIYDHDLGARKGPLFAADAVRYQAKDYLAYAENNRGDAAHGRQLFEDANGIACVRCHKAAGAGTDLGPDLSTIGAQSARQTLAESVLYPSKVLREGYQQSTIELTDGATVEGIVRGETPEVVTLRDAAGVAHDIPKPRIKRRASSQVSLMPEGLHAVLSLQDFADLVTYLESLR